ncbi:MAG: Zn-dependent hydrolase [Bacteroidetes bacterium]|nr:Zn-dependent hydrolase [Bacteroidota bacterium]
MKKFKLLAIVILAIGFGLYSCAEKESFEEKMKSKMKKFTEVELTTDLSWLSENEKEIIRILIDAANIMEEIYWMQSYTGDKDELIAGITNEDALKYVKINYGPWERLQGNEPFIDGYGPKPLGANYYPLDMTKEEFEAWDNPEKTSLYTLIRRDDQGKLIALPYSVAYSEKHIEAAHLIRRAAELADDAGLKKYLNMRAEALLSNDYMPSDYAWIEMKTNNIDFVVGPIENYEDRLFGYKAAHQAFILVKDLEWSAKLDKYSKMLPMLQSGMPVDPEYKAEVPGVGDMNVYYALYYAGDCNAGSKTIAINLPNAEEIHNSVGSRKLQLKNSMKAKFDKILVPISDMLICESQRKHIKFDAFFENTTFHEVAHGMGIKKTIDGTSTVREALKDHYSVIEEAKADILGLYLVTVLYEMGEITTGEVMDNYVTFLAGIFRSSRFGAASAHGKANMIRFNHFAKVGAFTKQEDGTYKVNFDEMKKAVYDAVEQVLQIQGDGNYEFASELIEKEGVMPDYLRDDLQRVNDTGLTIDIYFKQGKEVLGL